MLRKLTEDELLAIGGGNLEVLVPARLSQIRDRGGCSDNARNGEKQRKNKRPAITEIQANQQNDVQGHSYQEKTLPFTHPDG